MSVVVVIVLLCFLLPPTSPLSYSPNEAAKISLSSSSSSFSRIQIVPSRVEFDQVSRRYPWTWQRRLVSSVPYREYALYNVSFTACSEHVIIKGPSSSGKSTILKVLAGMETPTNGSVVIQVGSSLANSICFHHNHAVSSFAPLLPVAKPVYLDQRRRDFDDRPKQETVESILMKHAESELRVGLRSVTMEDTTESLGSLLVSQICRSLALDPAQCVSQLSSSQSYQLQLALASITSMFLGNYCQISTTEKGSNEHRNEDEQSAAVLCFAAPILLLDEWLDTETSTVIRAVEQTAIQGVTDLGGVVLTVTHKVERYGLGSSSNILQNQHFGRCRVLTLNRGEITKNEA